MHGRHALRAAPHLPPCPFPMPPMCTENHSHRVTSRAVLCSPVAGGDPSGMEGQGRSSAPPIPLPPVCPTSLTHAKHAGGVLGVAAVPRPVAARLLHGTARHGTASCSSCPLSPPRAPSPSQSRGSGGGFGQQSPHGPSCWQPPHQDPMKSPPQGPLTHPWAQQHCPSGGSDTTSLGTSPSSSPRSVPLSPSAGRVPRSARTQQLYAVSRELRPH